MQNDGFLRLFVLLTSLFDPTFFIKSSSAEYASLVGEKRCSLCPGGGEFKYADAIIPFYALPGANTPTCSDVAFVASLVPFDSRRCTEEFQTNAGYCGCPNIKQPNSCSFCPNGDAPERPELELQMGEICKNLHRYVSFFDDEQCESFQYNEIARNAYECGCDVSLSEIRQEEVSTRQAPEICNLCHDGSFPPDADFFLELAGLTCGDYAAFINSLDPKECEVQSSRGTFDLFAFQCQCPNTAPPVCPKQENPKLCTLSLLNSVDQDEKCECYSFCDGEFVGCDRYPGSFLGTKCPGTSVSGCNRASAIDDLNGYDGNVEDFESCNICPNSTNDIKNPEAILPPFSGVTIPGSLEKPTCQDLVEYLNKQGENDGDCQVAKSRLAHFCGCDGVEASCTLCPGGIPPSYTNEMATEDATCESFAETVLTWESETCEVGESYLSVTASRCGCVTTTSPPVCPIQQYPVLCTINLLRSTDEDCECYNFCGNEFHSCADYPGQIFNEPSDCPEGTKLITGCNRALATSQRCSRGSIGPPCNGGEDIATPYLRHLRH